MKLRPYQERAVDAVFDYFAKADGHPLIEAPTGAGKSLIIAEVVQRALATYPLTRVMMLTHVKELVEQNHDKLVALWREGVPPVGVYSAGLKRRDIEDAIIFGGVQSVYRCAADFGYRDFVIVDEAHRIPKDGMGMYRRTIDALREANPKLKVIGFTATPYRLDGGYLHEGKDRLFTDVAFSIPVGQLVAEGHLSRVVAREPEGGQIDTEGVATRGADFVQAELEAAALRCNVSAAVDEMVKLGTERGCKSWLVFACGVDHATKIAGLLQAEHGVEAAVVTGETKSAERERILDDFKAGRLRCLVNVNVLTTGFDAPSVDLLAMMRPTQSTSLYVQIVGRGTRTAPGKEKCLVLDYGGNVRRHGPIDAVVPKKKGKGGTAPMKECPVCGCLQATAKRECEDCGYAFPFEEREAKHEAKADTAAVMSFGPPPVDDWDEDREVVVHRVLFERHEKEGKPPSMRVTYLLASGSVSEWWCFEHGGFATKKAHESWLAFGGIEGMVPESTDEAIQMARNGLLTLPSRVTLQADGKYDRVVGRCFDPPLDQEPEPWDAKPEPEPEPEPGGGKHPIWNVDLDELPF